MKKMKLIFGSCLITIGITIQAQSKFLIDESTYGLFSVWVKDLNVDSTGQVKSSVLMQFSDDGKGPSTPKISSPTKDLYNSLCEYSFDASLNPMEKNCGNYTLIGGSFSFTSESIQSFIQKYPAFYTESNAPNPKLRMVEQGFMVDNYMYDQSLGEYYIKQGTQNFTPGVAATKKISFGLNIEKVGMINPQESTCTFVDGVADPQKADPTQVKRVYRFSTYDSKNSLVDSFSVNFKYPQIVDDKLVVYDKYIKDRIIGVLFVFDRDNSLGKKASDPAKNNHEIVLVGNRGQLILHTTARIGSDNMHNLRPWYAYFDEGLLSVFSDYIGLKDRGMYNFKINSDSVILHQYTQCDEASKLPVYVENGEGKSILNKSTKIYGHYWSGIDEFFKGYAHKILDNGDVVIWGRVMLETLKTGPAASGIGAPTSTITFTYKDFACLRYSDNLEFKEQFASTMVESSTDNEKDVLSVFSDNQFKFVLLIPTKETGACVYNSKMHSLTDFQIGIAGNAESAYKAKYLTINILGEQKIIKSALTPNNFALFYPGKFYHFTDNYLYLIGYQVIEKSASVQVVKLGW